MFIFQNKKSHTILVFQISIPTYHVHMSGFYLPYTNTRSGSLANEISQIVELMRKKCRWGGPQATTNSFVDLGDGRSSFIKESFVCLKWKKTIDYIKNSFFGVYTGCLGLN